MLFIPGNVCAMFITVNLDFGNSSKETKFPFDVYFCIIDKIMTDLLNFDGFTSRTPLGDSTLTLAARKGDLSLLKTLFNCLQNMVGVDAAVRLLSHHCNKLGKSVLHEAAQNSHVDCVRYLMEDVGIHPDSLKQGDWTPLMLACTKNNLEIVKLLVAKGADLNLKNKDGWTAFHIACREGNAEIVRYFLDNCTNVWETRSKNGRTPLHTASMYGRTTVAELLLNLAHYKVDEADNCGSTPLMDALRSGHVSIAKILVDLHKANCNQMDRLGRQALHLSCQTGQCNSVLWLIDEMDVNPDTRTTGNFMTSAHFAAKENQVDILRLLKEKNADFTLRDSHNRTALHMAASGQHAESIKYLLSIGLTDNLDSFDRLALNYAKKLNAVEAFAR